MLVTVINQILGAMFLYSPVGLLPTRHMPNELTLIGHTSRGISPDHADDDGDDDDDEASFIATCRLGLACSVVHAHQATVLAVVLLPSAIAPRWHG